MKIIPRLLSRPVRGVSGFTLIEILAGVAVIGILASVLIASLSGMREKAGTSVAASNLRQIGIGMLQFAADNSQNLPYEYWDSVSIGGQPNPSTWINQLSAYVEKDARAVSQNEGRTIWTVPNHKQVASGSELQKPSFGINIYMTTWQGTNWLYLLNRIPSRSKTIVVAESNTEQYGWWDIVQPADFPASGPGPALRNANRKKAHALFADGHVELRSAAELVSAPPGEPNLWKWW